MDEKNLSDQNEEATEDNKFANKTFLSIDERFGLNATSVLDKIKRRFCSKSKKFRFTFLNQKELLV